MRRATSICICLAVLCLFAPSVHAFPFHFEENFSTTTNRDSAPTTADWDTVLGQVSLPELPFVWEGSWTQNYDWIEIAGALGFGRSGGTVEILDLSDPVNPLTAGVINWAPQLVTPSCAAYNGRYLLVGTEELVSLFPRVVHDRLQVWDVQNPASPSFVGSVLVGGFPKDIEVAGGVAWVALGAAGVQGVDLSTPSAPVAGAVYPESGSVDRLARLGVELFTGQSGVGDGIVPRRLLGGTALGGGGWALVGSDVIDMEVVGGHLYFVGSPWLWDVDLDSLAFPPSHDNVPWTSAPTCVEGDGNWIVLGESDGSVEIVERIAGVYYARKTVIGSTSPPKDLVRKGRHLFVHRNDGSVDVLRLTEDLAGGDPIQVDSFAVMSGSATNFSADVEVVEDRLYVVGTASNVGLQVLDVSNPSSMQLLGTQAVGSSRVYSRVSVENEFAWLVDFDRVVAVDVHDPGAMGVVATVAPGAAFAVRDVKVQGDLLYVLGKSALQVYDVNNVSSPTLLGAFSAPLPADLDQIATNGSVLYLNDRNGWGLRVVDVHDPTAPSLLATIAGIKGDLQLAVDGNRLVTAGLMVAEYDITHPTSPVMLRASSVPDWTAGAQGLAVDGDRAYVTDLNGEMWIYDLAGTGTVPLIGRGLWGVSGSGDSWGMAVSGDHAFRYAWESDGVSLTQQVESLLVRRRWRDPVGAQAVSKGVTVDTRTLRAVRILASTTGNVSFQVETGETWTGTSSVAVVPGPQWTFLDPAVAQGSVFGELRWGAQLLPSPTGAAPTISNVVVEWLYEEPRIASWADVPADEGGAVSLSFTRCAYDGVTGAPAVADSYRVWREIDPNDPRLGSELVAVIPATATDLYSAVATVLADSVFGGPPTVRTGLHVEARMTGSPWQTVSPSILAMGIDNLDPTPAPSLVVNYAPWDGPNVLSWSASASGDVDYYRVYRATDPGLLDLALVDSTQTLGWSDPLYQQPGVYYAIDVVDDANRRSPLTLTSTVTAEAPVPTTSRLLPAFPNPFNPRTTIRFELAQAEPRLRLEVFDARGRRVKGLLLGSVEAGSHRVVFDGMDALGRPVASGLYFVRLRGKTVESVQKVILAK